MSAKLPCLSVRPDRLYYDIMPVSYDRQTTSARNPIVRFTHRRRLAMSVGEAARVAPRGGTLIDYGCGPGTYLSQIGQGRPDLSLIGYDPYAEQTVGGFKVVDDLFLIPDHSADLLVALETCEHLDESELKDFIAQTHRLLKPSGQLLISIPVIGGPGLLVKEANRIALHKRCDYSPGELAKAALLGKPAARPANIKITHKGFDFRALHVRLAKDMKLTRSWNSPFPELPWMLNSQVFSIWWPTIA